MRLVFFALAVALAGCTTIHTISVSPGSGELYVAVKKYPFPQGYVLRCSEKATKSGNLTMCTRVLNFAEAGQVGPTGNSSEVFTQERFDE